MVSVSAFCNKNTMTPHEYLLTCMAEECIEVAQRALKASRFTLTEIQPNQPLNNSERIMIEYADLLGVMELMQEQGLLAEPANLRELIEAKKVKVLTYEDYSRQLGAVK